MKNNTYLTYNNYLKDRVIENKLILVGKTKDSFIIGPKIDKNFDENSFYRRIKSNSIYNPRIYKRIKKKKRILQNLELYSDKLKSNEVIEIKKDGTIIIHKIIKVPGDK